MKKTISKNGQTLIEVVTALALVTIVILALVKITVTSIGNATFARNRASATKYAQGSIEGARNLRDSQPASTFFVINNSACTKDDTIGIFSRSRTCSLSVDEKTMTVVVIVSWTDGAGSHQSRLETNLTKWK